MFNPSSIPVTRRYINLKNAKKRERERERERERKQQDIARESIQLLR
jgi:hypothetical protein